MRRRLALLLMACCSVPFLAAWQPGDPLQESIARGAVVYENYCIACHQGDGRGEHSVYPPLDASDYLLRNPGRAAYVVKYGFQGSMIVNGVEYNNYMASMGLSDEEVADVMNYILNSWSNRHGRLITPEWVASIKR
jgi:mono/diheme cytochrome c family protein